MSIVGDFTGRPLVVAGQVWRMRAAPFSRRVVYRVYAGVSSDGIFAEFIDVDTPTADGRGELTCDELRATHELIYDATLIDPTAVRP